MCFIAGGRVIYHIIDALIGPMTYTDYIKLMDNDQSSTLTDDPLDIEAQMAFYDNVSFMIQSMYILKEKIPLVISLLERLETPTSDNNEPGRSAQV